MTSQNQQQQGFSPPLPTVELSHQLPVNAPVQTFPTKRHRLRTFFVLCMLMLALIIALSSVLGPNLFAKTPADPASNALPALGASGPFVKAPLNADQINAIMHLTG